MPNGVITEEELWINLRKYITELLAKSCTQLFSRPLDEGRLFCEVVDVDGHASALWRG